MGSLWPGTQESFHIHPFYCTYPSPEFWKGSQNLEGDEQTYPSHSVGLVTASFTQVATAWGSLLVRGATSAAVTTLWLAAIHLTKPKSCQSETTLPTKDKLQRQSLSFETTMHSNSDKTAASCKCLSQPLDSQPLPALLLRFPLRVLRAACSSCSLLSLQPTGSRLVTQF